MSVKTITTDDLRRMNGKEGLIGLSSISWTQKCENQPDKIKLSYSIGDKKLMAE